MGFIFDWTCPIIDDEISNYRCTVETEIRDLLDTHTELSDKRKQEIVNNYEASIYYSTQTAFERARQTNINMRDAAEKQIKDLEHNLSVANAVISDLEEERDEFENDKNKLKDEKTELESEIENLKYELSFTQKVEK